MTEKNTDADKIDPSQGRLVGGAGAVVRALRQAIVNREYCWNDQLPPERTLATQFGVSRGTVREALRRLQEMGFAVRRPGSGTFVRYRNTVDIADVAEMTSPLELIDVRAAIEPNITRLAAANANARDLIRLEKTLVSLENCGEDASLFSERDEEFHLELAECSRNPLMISIYRQINRVRGHTQWDARKDSILTPQRIAEYNQQHRSLFTALTERNVEKAVSVITRHIGKAQTDMLGSVDDAVLPDNPDNDEHPGEEHQHTVDSANVVISRTATDTRQH